MTSPSRGVVEDTHVRHTPPPATEVRNSNLHISKGCLFNSTVCVLASFIDIHTPKGQGNCNRELVYGMQQEKETDTGPGSRLQLAVAIAFVKSKRERDAQCEQLRGRVGQLEADLKRVKNTTLVVANALRRNQSATHDIVSSLLHAEVKDSAVAPSNTWTDTSTSSVLALTDNLRALLQGLHMLQLTSVTNSEQVTSWAFSRPHEHVCSYLSNTLLHQPPGELRRAYISACIKTLNRLLCTMSAGVESSEAVSSSIMQLITGLVRIVTGSSSTLQQNFALSSSSLSETEQPAIAILTEMAQAGPSIGQLLLLACANELQSAAATLAMCAAAVADQHTQKMNKRTQLCAAATLAPRCCAIMDLLVGIPGFAKLMHCA